jgi:sRNA-binding carbon storage regulator CsrA
MLLITCKCGEGIFVYPAKEVDRTMTIGELFANGPIAIWISDIGRTTAHLAIDAPEVLTASREEPEGIAILSPEDDQSP